MTTKGIVFYTNNILAPEIANKVQNELKKINLPITSCSLKKIDFGDNEVINEKSGKNTYFKQILNALERCNTDIVFFCEHDVLYNQSHFDFTPTENKFYFNINVYKWDYPKPHYIKVGKCTQVSGMVCFRELALKYYREQIEKIKRNEEIRYYEPIRNDEVFESKQPIIDIRHTTNMTKTLWNKHEYKNKRQRRGWKEVTEI